MCHFGPGVTGELGTPEASDVVVHRSPDPRLSGVRVLGSPRTGPSAAALNSVLVLLTVRMFPPRVACE